MKAVIIYRRLKDWRSGMLENIIFGLHNQGIDVEVINIKRLEYKKVDFVFQWYCSEEYYNIVHNYAAFQKVLSWNIEKGWFDRDRHFLLFNREGNRYLFDREVDWQIFKKPVKTSKEKYWIVIRQMVNDYNLRNCSDYNRWLKNVVNLLEDNAQYPVYVRNHPDDLKNGPPENTLDVDLGRAIGIVTWNSSTMFKAMMHNLPVCAYDLYEARGYYQDGLSVEWVRQVEKGNWYKPDYNTLLKNIAGQQWSITEFSKFDYKGMYEEHAH